MPRRAPIEYADRNADTQRYRLQQKREDAGGWALLKGGPSLDYLRETGPRVSGHVRVIDRQGRELVRWLNGKVK